MLEDRGYGAGIRWEPDPYTESLHGFAVWSDASIGLFEPSAAAEAPCYAYRYDQHAGRRLDALIDPCLLTDRDDGTGFDMSVVSGGGGVFVDLGSVLPISHVVVRTEEPAQGGRVLLADEGGEPQLVGMLDSAVTGLDLATPVMARRVFIETQDPATIVNIAAFTFDP